MAVYKFNGPSPGGPRILFVANVERDTISAEQLQALLEQAGGAPLELLFMQPDKRGLHSGKGLVVMSSDASAARAVTALHERVLSGRPLTLNWVADLPSTLRYLGVEPPLAATIKRAAGLSAFAAGAAQPARW